MEYALKLANQGVHLADEVDDQDWQFWIQSRWHDRSVAKQDRDRSIWYSAGWWR